MVVYENMVEAIFIERPNRFIAHCMLGGKMVIAHVKNTGRCKEILIPGAAVYLQGHNDPKRKTQYSLISVVKGERLINIDSQVPNKMVYEALLKGELKLPGINEELTYIKREHTYKHSRFDLYVETESSKGFIEIKGVTLENEGVAMFPDAPTERGVKHIYEIVEAKQEGYLSYILFVIQMSSVKHFEPNIKTHEAFARGLTFAKGEGITILAYDSLVSKDSIVLNEQIMCKKF